MNRSILSFFALSTLVAGCSSGADPEAASVDGAAAQGVEGTAAETGVPRIPLTVQEETAFCSRMDTADGGMCRVSTPSEPSPFEWTQCAQDAFAAIRPSQYYVPLSSDVALHFKKAQPDGTFETVVTVNRAKYVICSRNRLGVRNVPRAEVYARAGTAHVVVEAFNEASDGATVEGLVEYDNTAFAGRPALLEAALLFRSAKDGSWRESGRIVLSNDQRAAVVRGYAPPGVSVRLEIRGAKSVIGEPVAAIVNATLSLPGVCKWDEVSQTCLF